MWLVEKKVILQGKYDRKIIKDEINRILDGLSVDEISFCEKGAEVGQIHIDTNTGPNRTYLMGNLIEVCICICDKTKPNSVKDLKESKVIEIAKELRNQANSLKTEDFKTTCDSINKLLNKHDLTLLILYVEKGWIDRYIGNNKTVKVNYTTIINALLNEQNESKAGCRVLYGL